ncbi:MAG: AAA family ATPase, partial [Flavobacteriales bacterium]|nr:AAA family ATPase [Flavobacteriales bacterium]
MIINNFTRKKYKTLLQWKGNPFRKPLIIRGARQVGKSTLIHSFAKEFDHYIALNLEKDEHHQLFRNKSTNDLITQLLIKHNISISENDSLLLFIDEIQESPEAIKHLRYFYEEFP